MTPTGGEVYIYFRGIDYASTLGRQQLLANANVLASNRNLAQALRVGAKLTPLEGAGNWNGFLASSPTPYLPGISGAQSMRTMIGYLNSSMVGLVGETRRGALGDYLKRFPGAHRATWPDGIGQIGTQGIMVTRGRQPVAGVALSIEYDGSSHPTTSQGMVKRVLGQLFNSQRSLNRIEEIFINGS